jgi:hypothetical protein
MQTLWLKQQLTQKKLLHSPWSTMLEQQITKEEDATLSVVYDAETTTQSCYTDHNSRTLSHN